MEPLILSILGAVLLTAGGTILTLSGWHEQDILSWTDEGSWPVTPEGATLQTAHKLSSPEAMWAGIYGGGEVLKAAQTKRDAKQQAKDAKQAAEAIQKELAAVNGMQTFSYQAGVSVLRPESLIKLTYDGKKRDELFSIPEGMRAGYGVTDLLEGCCSTPIASWVHDKARDGVQVHCHACNVTRFLPTEYF